MNTVKLRTTAPTAYYVTGHVFHFYAEVDTFINQSGVDRECVRPLYSINPQQIADEFDALKADNIRLRLALSRQSDTVQQTLGKALGYPWYCRDQENFPGATEKDGVCVGEHTAESLADEAAAEIAELKATIERLKGK